nr:MAG TPA: hypothetical protein [Caudoviricetes sp.]
MIKSCILITCAVFCTYYLFLCFVSIYILSLCRWLCLK